MNICNSCYFLKAEELERDLYIPICQKGIEPEWNEEQQLEECEYFKMYDWSDEDERTSK